MGLPSEFMLTDVRCFAGEQRARLRPITLLVGENSTGKTTFLGCYSVLHQLFRLDRLPAPDPDFNREPFSMGSFRDIVRARLGPQGRIRTFEIGLKANCITNGNESSYLTKACFSESGSQPTISNIRYEFDDPAYFELTPTKSGNFNLQTPVGFTELENEFNDDVSYILFYLNSFIHFPNQGEARQNKLLQTIFKYVSKYTASIVPDLPIIIPVAPLRSKPNRTYNPVREISSPEGDHVPMLMMRLDRTGDVSGQLLRESLAVFGQKSGMFSDIRVRRLGKQMSDPFQMQIKARSGTPANIMDVGYGVSQSLPILVDIYSHRDSVFLLQQPEVHLHPRAQAELATVFADSVRNNGNNFMIETHSDHIVDRMRILVRQGKIPAEDVSILYFEPTKNAVQIHNIELDSDGNLENVPPGYRDFFLRESDRLLGFED